MKTLKLIQAIIENKQESRREWLLWVFERAGRKNSNNKKYQFWRQDNQPIDPLVLTCVSTRFSEALVVR